MTNDREAFIIDRKNQELDLSMLPLGSPSVIEDKITDAFKMKPNKKEEKMTDEKEKEIDTEIQPRTWKEANKIMDNWGKNSKEEGFYNLMKNWGKQDD